MKVDITVSSNVEQSPRVLQMQSMFDVPAEEKSTRQWSHELPTDEKPWQVGLIVGPSGAGKTTLARELYGDALMHTQSWSPDRSVLDDFPKGMSIKDVVGLLTAVGLSSPPAWMRPFHTLSNGEAFRAAMARALAENPTLLAVDEFTSVVDRQVAKVVSHTVQKTVRRDPDRQFVAVTCHYDVVDWLQPDWVYDVSEMHFQWRSVQPHPPLDINVYPVDKTLWRVFSPHHYLSGDLHTGAQCFGAFIGDQCIGFTSYIHFPHPNTKNIKRGHRLVVLPDYQGLGIGGRLDDWLGLYLWERGYRYHNVIAHPAMVRYYAKSPRWREVNKGGRKLVKKGRSQVTDMHTKPRFLGTRSFAYTPPEGGSCATLYPLKSTGSASPTPPSTTTAPSP